MPSQFTLEVFEKARESLPFSDRQDFEEQSRGFIAAPESKIIMADAGHVAWDMERYEFLLEPDKINTTTDKWGVGPSVVVLTMPGHWVVGSLVNNVWSFAGSGANDINLFTWQYFLNYNMPGGSYFTTAPIITANWEANSGDKWTIPFGGGIGQIFKLGSQPVNFNVQAYYNVKKPEFGGSWQLRVQWQFLFPK